VSVARCREINARLRAAGITVHELPGWEARGNGFVSAYEGGIVHHTGGPFGAALPGNGRARELINGSPKLRGPLCNYAGNEDGSITVVAAHPANHAGASGGKSMGPLPRTRSFNKRVLGLEIIYPGFEPMRDAQYQSAVRWSHIVAHVVGRGDVERIRAHAETSITGKWDPGFAPPDRTIDMNAFRAAARQGGEDMNQAQNDTLNALAWRLHALINGLDAVPDRDDVHPAVVRGEQMWFVQLVKRLEAKVDNIVAAGDVTPERLKQVADSLAKKVPGELADQFQAELRAAFDRLKK
jgi:hypothetical protein